MSVLPNNSVGLCNFILKKNQNDQKFQLLELFNKKRITKLQLIEDVCVAVLNDLSLL